MSENPHQDTPTDFQTGMQTELEIRPGSKWRHGVQGFVRRETAAPFPANFFN